MKHPGITVHLQVDFDHLIFEPELDEINVALMDPYDQMKKAVEEIPRVEKKLFTNYFPPIHGKDLLQPNIDVAYVDKHKQTMMTVLAQQKEEPLNYMESWKPYDYIITNQVTNIKLK